MASRKGSPNNVTGDCKQSIMSVYTALGGAEGLLKWAQKNQTDYYKMLVAILPKEYKVQNENPLMMLSAVDIANLIADLGRARGIALPSTIEGIVRPQDGTLPALYEAEAVS